MDYRLLFPSLYLAAHDLKGEDRALTIRNLVVESLKTAQGEEKKPCLYFEETKAAAERSGKKEKRLVLNKTNASMIASLHGNEVDDWKGKRITLYPTKASAFGEMKDCIRVRGNVPTGPDPTNEPQPQPKTQPQPAEKED